MPLPKPRSPSSSSLRRTLSGRDRRAQRRYGLPHECPSPSGGPGAGVLLDPLYPHLGLFRVRRLKHWKIYGDEGLARREVTLWLSPEILTMEFAGEPLAHYDVEYSASTNHLREVKGPQLFETSNRVALVQLRLFELDALGETGWLKVLRLDKYAPWRSRRPQALQEAFAT
jgi:hypothetical protein